MKTLYFSIIVVIGIVAVVSSFNTIFAQNVTNFFGIQNSTTIGTPLSLNYTSPLHQTKIGTTANNVFCKEGFKLVIKTEDGSPACVKPETAQKLIERGWASEIITTNASSVTPTQNPINLGSSNIQTSTCDNPYNPKTDYPSPLLPNGTHTITGYIPIFYMPMNSTGKICVHYSNSNPPRQVGIRIFEANDLAKDAYTITTSASQNTIPTGNTTVVYTIKTGNKAGFYGISLFCGGQAFAVGYDNQSRIVLDDFPWYGKIFNCPMLSYDFKIVGLSGIGLYYITETTREQIGYNITGVSVSSVHPTPTSQNVTFAVNVRTYNTGAKLWFDYEGSGAVKFIGDPQLKEGSDPCYWSFNNDKSVDRAQWLKLVGGFRVTDNPVTIPPYSNGTYTFSIFAKNLDYGWYGLFPIIFSESLNSNIPLENLAGQAIANHYPITIGIDSKMDPSGVCER
jgi:hypothetical protein